MDFINSWISILKRDGEAAVATLVNGTGSIPRENGAQMIVSKSEIIETVGGGRLEADIIKKSREALKNKTSAIYGFELSNSDASLSGMICGGKVEAVIYYSSIYDLTVLERIGRTSRGWLLYPIDEGAGLCYVASDGEVFGDAGGLGREMPGRGSPHIEKLGDVRYLVQWIESPGQLHIFGAGHVSRELAKIAHILGIECHVYDDRPEYVNYDRFPHAHCVLVEDMSAPPDIALNKKDMAVIITRGHVYDGDCLARALGTEAGYIGMIGSRRKAKMVLSLMLEKGFPEERVKAVRSPIGIDIGARTPSEIAVSIAAELIRFIYGL
ncbi:MAG: XdhC family protein [Oscillospiraceae bacterium]|jgi:xanthine dehydrogenase accessory factor